MTHRTCNDPSCATCNERERLVHLDLERGMRPGGKLRVLIASIQVSAKRMRERQA